MINILINSGYSFFSLRKNLVEYLLNKNLELKIITPNNSQNIKKKIKSSKFKVTKFKLYENKKSLLNLIKNFLSIYQIFKKQKKTTNVIFGSYLNLIFGILSFFILSKKNIFVFTGLGSLFNSKNKIIILIVKQIFNLVALQKNTLFIFYNRADRKFLLKKIFFFKSKIISGSGIEVKKNTILKNRADKTVNFIFYSRFNYDKGILDLINSINIVNSKGYEKKCNFFFYGLFDDNPTSIKKNKLKELINQNNNCYLKETNYNVNLKKIFLDKHIFVLPSLREGMPKTALEAMNFNKALLLSNIPGHNFLINKKNVNGLYFKKNDEIDLSNKIIWMIENKKKIIKFSINSKKNLLKFSSEKINQKYYETII